MTQLVSLALGIATLAAVWLLPLHQLVPGAFSAHMTMHMGVVAIAAPLVSYGVAGGRLDPVRKLPWLFAPIPASIVELVVVWAWHAPLLHHAARQSPWMMGLEQGSFLLCGLLVWLAVLGGSAMERDSRRATGVVALLLTSMHMTLLGALLALPPRALYSHAHSAHSAHAAYGTDALSPLADQHLGGAIMLIVGGISYLAGGLFLMVELLLQRRAMPPSRQAVLGAEPEEGDA
jgi:putative membrane protein